jgi:hypothetical protein
MARQEVGVIDAADEYSWGRTWREHQSPGGTVAGYSAAVHRGRIVDIA